ncbi:MAG TPA: HAD-IA family hydrolase [Chloroflexota bacterium]|nr:HAD-IA family hydrolase [Chloroflexota bacterium]
MAVVQGERKNLTAQAYQVLFQRILSHTIAPGEAINDAALAQELGVACSACLFMDDLIENIEAARRLGMATI